LPFSVTVVPATVSVLVGQRAILACRLQPKMLLGSSVASLEWYRADGKDLSSSCSLGELGVTLTVDPAGKDDDGEYVCSASDGFRTEIDSGFVLVRGCQPDQHACSDGSCFPASAVCDGKADCVDGGDEANCGKAYFNAKKFSPSGSFSVRRPCLHR